MWPSKLFMEWSSRIPNCPILLIARVVMTESSLKPTLRNNVLFRQMSTSGFQMCFSSAADGTPRMFSIVQIATSHLGRRLSCIANLKAFSSMHLKTRSWTRCLHLRGNRALSDFVSEHSTKSHSQIKISQKGEDRTHFLSKVLTSHVKHAAFFGGETLKRSFAFLRGLLYPIHLHWISHKRRCLKIHQFPAPFLDENFNYKWYNNNRKRPQRGIFKYVHKSRIIKYLQMCSICPIHPFDVK